MKLFKRQPDLPKVIVLNEKPTPMVEDEESIKALAHHPGFVALMNRLKLQRAVVEAKLKTVRVKDLREVDFLQLGLFWLNYLQDEVDKTVLRKPKPVEQVEVTPTHEEEFRKAISLIESIRPPQAD